MPRGAATEPKNPSIPGITRTVWGQQKLEQSFPKLKEDISADICVIGGSITGASIAYSLQKEGALLS